MVVNESLLLSEIANAMTQGNIGFYVDSALLFVGGLGGATLIYFGSVIYFQYKHLKAERETLELLRLETALLEEQYKMVCELHKVLIVEVTQQHEGDHEVGAGQEK